MDPSMTTGILFTAAAYGVYAAFWLRFLAHLLLWGRAARHASAGPLAMTAPPRCAAWPLYLRDVILFWRLLKANPRLWLGEWVFHVSLLLVLLRYLRYFLDPVPQWVWDLQLPGLLAGY